MQISTNITVKICKIYSKTPSPTSPLPSHSPLTSSLLPIHHSSSLFLSPPEPFIPTTTACTIIHRSFTMPHNDRLRLPSTDRSRCLTTTACIAGIHIKPVSPPAERGGGAGIPSTPTHMPCVAGLSANEHLQTLRTPHDK